MIDIDKYDELYLNLLRNNINYCKMALIKMSKEISVDNNDTYSFFYHAQNFFCSASNIDKLLNGNEDTNAKERSKRLKNLLKINGKDLIYISNRQFRNTNEHYAQRIDMLKEGNYDFFYLDNMIYNQCISNTNINIFGRTYCVNEKKFIFLNGELKPTTIYLDKMEKDILKIEAKLNSYINKNL